MTLMEQGWVCPICGNVNAPWVASCPCGGNPQTRITTSSGTDYKKEKDKVLEEFLNRWPKS